MNPSPKSLLDRLVATTFTLLLVAIGLSWSWHLLRPLLPVLVVAAVIVVAWRVLRRRNEW